MSANLTSFDVPFLARFENLRQTLLNANDPDKLDRTLAYWVSAGDRRLPLALMSQSLRSLLELPFAELSRTQGVGRKKLAKLLELLERAAAADLRTMPPPIQSQYGTEFDPDAVSEAQWEQWRRAVRESGLGEQPLGRFACSLQELPRVVWWAPLNDYTELTLTEIGRLKTHGVKRVRAIVRTFAALQAALGEAGWAHLSISVTPQFVRPLELWLLAVRGQHALPSRQELLQGFVEPVLRQLAIDAGDDIAQLAANRLGVGGEMTSVRAAAAELGLTRARVYQLLAGISQIMDVRWPDGCDLVHQVRRNLEALDGQSDATRLFTGTADLLFPRTANTNGHSPRLQVSSHRRLRAG